MRRRRFGETNLSGPFRTTASAVLVVLSALALLDPDAAGAQSLQPPQWDAGIRIAEATDRNPDPDIVEVDFEARVATVEIAPGLKVDAWTYNGAIPGPTIRVKVGDRLIVHFTNNLPRPSTIHWHGLRIPIDMDGVPGYSQDPVRPGETFTYDFVVPDAGIYWYHPHVMSAAQVGFGLYGAFLVEDPTETVGIADDLVLVLSDIDVARDGELLPADTGGTVGMLFGREGNQVLVNGRRLPELVARAGAPQRWRIVNAAKSRYFKLDLGEGNVFRKIGGDGGLTEYSEDHDFIVLGAGERADVLVAPAGERGSEGLVRSLAARPRLRKHLRARLRELVNDPLRGRAALRGRPAAQYEPRYRTLRPRGRDGNRPGADPAGGSVRPDLRLRDQSRALLEGETDPGEPGRDAGLDRDQLHCLVAPVASARLLLHGARRGRRTGAASGVEGHGGHPARADGCAWRCASRTVQAPGSSTATSSITPTGACSARCTWACRPRSSGT